MQHWSDIYFSRVGQAKKTYPIAYTKDNPLNKRLQAATAATESAKPTTKEAKDNVVAWDQPLKKPDATGYGRLVLQALNRAGFPSPAINFVYVMLYMESGGFTNGPAQKDNNPGNIMYFPGAKKGVFVAANGTYAAHFDNLDSFAKQLRYEMNKGARPMAAKTLYDFAYRLKMNNYYGKEDLTTYLGKLTATARKLGMTTGFNEVANKTRKKMDDQDKESWFKKHPLVTGIIIAAGAVVVIKAVK